ncbi:MAG: protease Do, partial [Gallionellaceae bacterium]
MFKRLFVFALFGLYVPSVLAKDLPDFTALVEKQGAAVVNVSTSQTIQASQGVPPIPGLPEGDPLAELFRRFGSPMPREQETHSL